jgi:restriction system protein
MPIPDYQTLMRPLLELLADGDEHPLRDLRAALADKFELSQEEREQMLPSGTARLFDDRVSWARYYLQRAGMLEPARRSVYRITTSGRALIAEVPDRVTVEHLSRRSPDFRAWVGPSRGGIKSDGGIETSLINDPQTPEELMAAANQSLRRAVEADVLTRLRACSPAFFERVVVRLLVAMGYGGTLQDAGRAIGRSGDEGIDGIIKEDRLGLDAVYVQAKRWTNTVGRPEIQQFAGALAGHRARKGVFITTSAFSAEAKAYIGNVDTRIVLIDGETLARFMFEHGVGVATTSTYEVKRLDTDFFEEE